MQAESVELATPAGPATAELSVPDAADALLVLTHGAGGGVATADLLAVRDAASSAGVAVALLTQPFRVAGRRTPPAPGPQDAAWLAALTALTALSAPTALPAPTGRSALNALPLLVGGRSNGARVACRTARASGALAVVALAFPLHPPGRPEQTRLPELDGAGVPVLVVQGDRDPFGMPPRGRARKVVVIPGADHNLRRDTATLAREVVRFVTAQLSAAGDRR